MTGHFPLLPLTILLSSCLDPGTSVGQSKPYIDEWRVVASTPDAAALKHLSIGDRSTFDNFANRGDIEVIFDPDSTGIIVEMQRFTVAHDQKSADEAFRHMEYWGYNSPSAAKLDPISDADILCFTPGNDACYVRAYFDAQIQPMFAGANFRVTLPAGWNGELEVVTSDNIYAGVDYHPDRSDVEIVGLSGSLHVDLDSGNVEIVVDPHIDPYVGCPLSETCELGDPDEMPPLAPFDPACGCTYPTSIIVENGLGQASDVTIDLPTTSPLTGEGRWYSVSLENRTSETEDFGCTVTIDCDAFGPDCVIDPEVPEIVEEEDAEINYPGEPALLGGGIQIDAESSACLDVAYLEDPEDYGWLEFPHERRGDLHVCSGCLR